MAQRWWATRRAGLGAATDMSAGPERIYLSSPHMGGLEQSLVSEAFATNWIAPVGPHVEAFEREFCQAVGARHAAALSSGTAALHLALQLVGVRAGEEVLVSTLTFSGTVNPILYLNARPVFIDSERDSWNMDPVLLAETLQRCARRGRLPAAVLVVHLYGQSADMAPIMEACDAYGIPVVEDAAEALGATCNGLAPGTLGRVGIYSFNGNKIITTAGGGMLVSADEGLVAHARKLATQARDPAPHYQHSEVGYNYRLSNVLAGIGRGQLRVLEDRVAARRRNFAFYQQALGGLPGVKFMPEARWGSHTRWLTCLTIDPDEFGASREDIRLSLEAQNIEARPVWKPMHLQPVFARYAAVAGAVAEELFECGLCLPSGSNLTPAQLERVAEAVTHMCPAGSGNGRSRSTQKTDLRADDPPLAAPSPNSGEDRNGKHAESNTGSVQRGRGESFHEPMHNGAQHVPVARAARWSARVKSPAFGNGREHRHAGTPRTQADGMPGVPVVLIHYRRAVLIGLHLLLIPFGYLLAFALRFDFAIPPRYVSLFWATLVPLMVVRVLTLGAFNAYNGWLRHVGMYDLVRLMKAITASSALFLVTLFLLGTLQGYPRSVLFLEWCMAILMFGGIRIGVRWAREGATRLPGADARRALIIGAGDVAASLIRQMRLEPASGIHPVGIVDDDPDKHGLQIHGVQVLGSTEDLPQLVRTHRARLLVLAIAVAERGAMNQVLERCRGLNVELKVVPSLCDLLSRPTSIGELRSVQIEDLLGRPAVSLDMDWVRREFADKCVLITGGAGSIGSELGRQIAAFHPGRLVLGDRAENALYFAHLELSRDHPGVEVVPALVDVTDRNRLAQVFQDHRPDFVFHAAAYKHVPMMEANIAQAVLNNVFGTLNVAECAARYGAARFILVSTDKAVRPSSVMGATKRVAERIALELRALAESHTDFRAVRFGNVLGSDGSVVPLFKRQIEAGGPITVTHPDVTRYFMTIPEAVQLMLQAAVMPEAARRICMLEMGEPVRIVDLAENLIRLSGLEPHTQLRIVFTGLRPGEKLHEELMSDAETTVETTVEKIRIVNAASNDANGLENALAVLASAHASHDQDEMLSALCLLAPESISPLCDRARAATARLSSRPLLATA
jgi:pyridoxal phosphate-dependent aminotransferase EpsN